jgi:hypothetical protein
LWKGIGMSKKGSSSKLKIEQTHAAVLKQLRVYSFQETIFDSIKKCDNPELVEKILFDWLQLSFEDQGRLAVIAANCDFDLERG